MIEMHINNKEIEDIMKRLDRVKPGHRTNVLTGGMRLAALMIERDLKIAVGGTILNVRSNRLRSSIGSRVYERSGELSAVVGSGARHGNRVKYANIHETGGTITPKRTKFLAIPLAAARTRGGDQRAISPKDFENTFIRNGVIYQKQGKKIIPLFVLKKSVRIPARKYLSKTLAMSQAKIMTQFQKQLERGLSLS